MLNNIRNHPFAVQAHFEYSMVLTYAVPKEQVRHLIPECLEPDTFNDTWAFIAVAMVHAKGLRPKGSPAFMGNDFFLTGYRVFVTYHHSSGKRMRGLYILRSETDNIAMKLMGNLFTHYHYTTTDIAHSSTNGITTIRSQQSAIDIAVSEPENDLVQLPEHSPFANWKEARRFAGPLPFTFTFNEQTNEVLIIEGVRENWTPRPLNVIRHQVPLVHALGLKDIVLANAFIIRDIPYYWKKGRTDKWTR
jgi:uncharacterized protein YqjF (DUF2071 family)